MVPGIWYIAPLGAFTALIFAFIFYLGVKKEDPGNAQMQKIAKYVRDGALPISNNSTKVWEFSF